MVADRETSSSGPESYPEDSVFIPNDLASTSYMSFIRQALPRFMGYASHEYQSSTERRRILERAYNVNFPTSHITDEDLVSHIEQYGPPRSKERFERICRFLTLRGRSLIEKNVEKRIDDNHRSFRQVYQTFEDGMWFVGEFGRNHQKITMRRGQPIRQSDVDFVGYGRVLSESLPRSRYPGLGLLPLEPLLVFEIEELPTSHDEFLHPGVNLPVECPTLEESVIRESDGEVRCSVCGMGYYSETPEISNQRYKDHGHLIRLRFDVREFTVEGFHEEWALRRGTLSPEEEDAIASAYLSDHIAPMRADTEEMMGIPGDSVRRYKLDRVHIGTEFPVIPIEEKWRWPIEVRKQLSNILERVERQSWEASSDEQKIEHLKEIDAYSKKRIKEAIKSELSQKLRFKEPQEFDFLLEVVIREWKANSNLAIAGHAGGTRYALFSECTECNAPEVEFGDGHECRCHICLEKFTGSACDNVICLLNPTKTMI